MAEMILKATGSKLQIISAIHVTSTQAQYDTCLFEFDEAWDSYQLRTAVFYSNPNNIKAMLLDADNKCYIPWDSFGNGRYLYIGVYGNNGESYLPTQFVEVMYQPGANVDDHLYPPTPGIYEQIANGLVSINEKIDLLNTSYPAENVTITDAGNLFSSANIEGALAEVGKYIRASSINVLVPPPGLVPVDYAAADNSDAINAMIQWLLPGGELFFPAGTCRVENPIIIDKYQITLRGEGQRSIIQNDGTGDALRIVHSTGFSSRVSLLGIRVTGNALSGYGLYVYQMGSRLVVRDCEFSGHGFAGVYMQEAYSSVFYSTNVSGNCLNPAAVYKAGMYAREANNIVVHGCHFTNNQNGGAGLILTTTVSGIVDGNQFEDNYGTGVEIRSCRGVSLSSNYVENNGLNRTIIEPKPALFNLHINGSVADPSMDIVVNGGIYNGAGVTNFGIVVANSKGTVINGAYCYRNLEAGIRISNTSEDTIINNTHTAFAVPADADPLNVSDAGINSAIRYGATLNTKVPTTAADIGKAGTIATDANYIYICTATNTWKRLALTGW